MTVNILVSAFAPFPSLSLSVPSLTPVSSILPLLEERYPLLPVDSLRLSTHSGAALVDDAPVSTLLNDSDFFTLRLAPRLLGGKGGFGSQLRAAGGRMSSQKTSNNDSCRDLSGRRLSTIKEAKKLAEYLEAEPERTAARAEAQKAKLEALERKLGIEPRKGSSSGTSTPGQSSPAPVAGKKHRFEDTEYLEQSKELVDGVKNAVSAALLKKKKKAKLTHDTSTTDKNAKAPAAATIPASTGSNVEAVGA
ncbi:telomere stability and silencing-domain-containing protein [Armillaria fumosa]|nr:telomere stability and silencing-domain-containing protein [Armillaria fumosa]